MKVFLFLMIIVASSAHAKTTQFTIDPAHSSVDFSVNHLGIIPVNGSFKKFEGTFDFDQKTGKATNLVVKIDVDSIFTNEDDRDAHLKSKDFFNVRDDSYDIVKKNQYMTFTAKKLSLTNKKITGVLKVLKAKKKLTLDATIKPLKGPAGIAKIGVQAKGKVNRTELGLTWQKPTTGFIAKAAGNFVGEEVTISINVLAQDATQNKKKIANFEKN